MADEIPGNSDKQENLPIKDKPLVKGSWFEASLQGNSLWPQYALPGIGILTAAAVLKDPPVDWHDFFVSQTSEEQLRKTTEAMNGHHRRRRINRMTEPYAKEEKDIVTPEAIERVWTGAARGGVKVLVGNFITSETGRDIDIVEDEPVIEAFLKDPANAEKLRDFTQIINIAKETVLGKDMLDLAELFRFTLDPGPLEQEDEERYNELWDRYKEEYLNTFPNNSISTSLRMGEKINSSFGLGIRQLADKKTVDAIKAELPDTDVDWMKNLYLQVG